LGELVLLFIINENQIPRFTFDTCSKNWGIRLAFVFVLNRKDALFVALVEDETVFAHVALSIMEDLTFRNSAFAIFGEDHVLIALGAPLIVLG
jgi:hypothetical protein